MTTTDKITPEAVKAALDAATPGPWFASEMQGPRTQTNFARVFAADDDLRYIADCRDTLNFHSKTDNEANARLIAMAPDLATAYLAQAEEIERLRKRIEAADRLSEAVGKMRRHPVGVLNEVAEADTAYRATEERG